MNWVPSATPWTHRWDMYLKGNPDDEIHYFSIVNSLMIVRARERAPWPSLSLSL